jgi:hypothetical protein
MACRNCNTVGHYARNCPDATFGGASARSCYNCKMLGHIARNCPQVSSPHPPRRGNRPALVCYSCRQPGHLARDCPSPAGVPSSQAPVPDSAAPENKTHSFPLRPTRGGQAVQERTPHAPPAVATASEQPLPSPPATSRAAPTSTALKLATEDGGAAPTTGPPDVTQSPEPATRKSKEEEQAFCAATLVVMRRATTIDAIQPDLPQPHGPVAVRSHCLEQLGLHGLHLVKWTSETAVRIFEKRRVSCTLCHRAGWVDCDYSSEKCPDCRTSS